MRRHRRYRLIVPPRSAKLFVINRRKDGRIFTANRTLGIASEVKFPEFHSQRVEVEKTFDERLTDADDQLDRLNRLQHPDNARQDAEHSRLRAVWYCVRRRRLRE